MTMGAVRLASAPQCPDARGACLLEREVRREVGLRQLGLGGGLALLALGVWLLQRGERAAETG